MSQERLEDLKYWSDKWNDAEQKLYGEQKIQTIKVCQHMADLYLDLANKEKL
jgi:hypothetical protein